MERNDKKETKKIEKKENKVYQKPQLTKYRQINKVVGLEASPVNP